VGALVLDAVVMETRTVESQSMVPALSPGERLVVAKSGFDPWALARGEVVVFDAADLWAERTDPAGTVFVKRIIGVPGDRIRCCDDAGRVIRNGTSLDEPYVRDPASDQVAFDITVQPGHYWLMGDNRAGSADSRAHLGDPGGGNVPASRIIGTVEAVVWPPGSMRRVEGSDDGAS
jgi:signal peptidase I